MLRTRGAALLRVARGGRSLGTRSDGAGLHQDHKTQGHFAQVRACIRLPWTTPERWSQVALPVGGLILMGGVALFVSRQYDRASDKPHLSHTEVVTDMPASLASENKAEALAAEAAKKPVSEEPKPSVTK